MLHWLVFLIDVTCRDYGFEVRIGVNPVQGDFLSIVFSMPIIYDRSVVCPVSICVCSPECWLTLLSAGYNLPSKIHR